MSAPRREDATRPALPADRRARAESRRWAEVRRAVREAKALDLYAIEVRGVKATLKKSPPKMTRTDGTPVLEEDPPHKEPSARQLKAKERSRVRKDAFHAKKREEAAAAAEHSPSADVVHHAPQDVRSDDQPPPGDDDMRPAGRRGRADRRIAGTSDSRPSSGSAAAGSRMRSASMNPLCVGRCRVGTGRCVLARGDELLASAVRGVVAVIRSGGS